MPVASRNSVLVNKELQRLGFGTLKDPNLFDQMAMVIRDHQHFRRLLMSVEQGQRHIAYEALASKLRFKAKPLEDYEIESRQLAEQNRLPHYDPKTLVVTEVKPTEIQSPEYREACKLAEVAEKAIDRDLREEQATQMCDLVCARCTYGQQFRLKKRSALRKVAGQYGWTFSADGTRALCRACSPKPTDN